MPVDLETALQQAPVETKPEKKEFIIDPVERTITVPNTLLGVFSDRNVKRLYFKCPRVVEDNIDLSKCQAFINYVSASGKLGQYLIKDIAVQNQDIIFSWLLSENLFDLNAEKDIWFAVQFKTSTGENVFNTTKAKGIIKETVDAGTYVEEQYADIILDLIAQVDDIKKNPVKPEQIEKAVQDYFSKHPVEGGATVEQLAQIEKNKQDIIKLSQKKIPVKISELTNDSDFKTGSQVDQKITAHDTNPLAHSDLREELKKLQQRIQTALNSDDVSLDQLSEIVAYIKSNKALIDEITTNKVNVSDVINNLTTNNFKKPLSAAQGVVLKTLIDGIVVPKKLSQLQNDQKFQTDTEVKAAIDQAFKENPPSGGEKQWTKVIEETVQEDFNAWSKTTDMNGKELSFTEALIIVSSSRASSQSSNGNFVISTHSKWNNSFNKFGMYGYPLFADVYTEILTIKLINQFAVEYKNMGHYRTANTIENAQFFNKIPAALMPYESTKNNTIRPIQAETTVDQDFLNAEGKMHALTIGTDLMNSVKLSAGTKIEMWIK